LAHDRGCQKRCRYLDSIGRRALPILKKGIGLDVFDDVPKRLVDAIRQLPGVVGRDLIYIAAAGGVAAEYIGKRVFGPDPDPFLGADKKNASGNSWYGYSLRILLIGETLFGLRLCNGFEEFCKRLRQRDLRSAFYELLGARIFLRAGFEIYGRPITGVKGQDFDFHAVRDSEAINVEVTSLTAQIYSPKTLANSLHDKRRQVPKSAPAIVICVLPDSWSADQNVWNLHIPKICKQFLRTTQRINGVLYLMERYLGENSSGGGGMVLHQNAVLNARPYFQIKDTTFLFKGAEMSPALLAAISDPTRVTDYIEETQTSEFYRWVDHLVPKAQWK
jgi:hypothetical protein